MSEQEKTEQDFIKKKTFKLCFASQNLIGRSNIQIGKPLKLRKLYYTTIIIIIKISFTVMEVKHFVNHNKTKNKLTLLKKSIIIT